MNKFLGYFPADMFLSQTNFTAFSNAFMEQHVKIIPFRFDQRNRYWRKESKTGERARKMVERGSKMGKTGKREEN